MAFFKNFHIPFLYSSTSDGTKPSKSTDTTLSEIVIINNEAPIAPAASLPLPNTESIKSMNEYLGNRERHDCNLAISYPKSALKSYDKGKLEKRYFAPKPRMDLTGMGWNSMLQKTGHLTPQDSNFLDHFNATCEVDYDIANSETPKLPSKDPKKPVSSSSSSSISFNIFCNDGKQLRLNFGIFFGNALFGSLQSNTISLISKPSKSTNICDESSAQYPRIFKSGDKIAIFNRIVTNCPTHLTMDGNGILAADGNQWNIFEIYKVDEFNPFDENGNIIHRHFEQITYDSAVILVDFITKSRSPILKIRTTKFQKKLKHSGIPISELHQCVFEYPNAGYMTSDPTTFKLSFDKSSAIGHDKYQWFIVTANLSKYQFCAIKSDLKEEFCIQKFPLIFEMFPYKIKDEYFCKIRGENFSAKTKVWIGSFECETFKNCYQTIEFSPPTLEAFNDHCQRNGIPFTIRESHPVMLVTEDGILFQTFFAYCFIGTETVYECGQFYAVA